MHILFLGDFPFQVAGFLKNSEDLSTLFYCSKFILICRKKFSKLRWHFPASIVSTHLRSRPSALHVVATSLMPAKHFAQLPQRSYPTCKPYTFFFQHIHHYSINFNQSVSVLSSLTRNSTPALRFKPPRRHPLLALCPFLCCVLRLSSIPKQLLLLCLYATKVCKIYYAAPKRSTLPP